MLYDETVHDTADTAYLVTGSGNVPKNVYIKQSDFHIVIEPKGNNSDRYLIQDVVKKYAKQPPMRVSSSNRVFKTVLINNIDKLSYYGQTSLRRTLEKYSDTCRFIMWSRSLSKVIEPLRSRCYCFRIKAPTRNQIIHILLKIAAKEGIDLDMEEFTKIAVKSGGNIKKAIWSMDQHRAKLLTVRDKGMNTIRNKWINRFSCPLNMCLHLQEANKSIKSPETHKLI